MASHRPGATLVVSSAIALAGFAACGGSSNSNPAAPSKVGAATTFSLTGNVTDSTTASGIAAATVSISSGPNAGKVAMTDASGAYVLSALQPSTFTIRASAANYLAQSKNLDLTGQQTLAFQLSRPAVFVGAKYDTIETAHQVLFGIPTPTQIRLRPIAAGRFRRATPEATPSTSPNSPWACCRAAAPRTSSRRPK